MVSDLNFFRMPMPFSTAKRPGLALANSKVIDDRRWWARPALTKSGERLPPLRADALAAEARHRCSSSVCPAGLRDWSSIGLLAEVVSSFGRRHKTTWSL